MKDIFNVNQIESHEFETSSIVGSITEKERFIAAKQILLGLASLYTLTLLAYLFRPIEGLRLIDICTTTFPPLATLILVFYFKDHR